MQFPRVVVGKPVLFEFGNAHKIFRRFKAQKRNGLEDIKKNLVYSLNEDLDGMEIYKVSFDKVLDSGRVYCSKCQSFLVEFKISKSARQPILWEKGSFRHDKRFH